MVGTDFMAATWEAVSTGVRSAASIMVARLEAIPLAAFQV
jgi:hypothetical protein